VVVGSGRVGGGGGGRGWIIFQFGSLPSIYIVVGPLVLAPDIFEPMIFPPGTSDLAPSISIEALGKFNDRRRSCAMFTPNLWPSKTRMLFSRDLSLVDKFVSGFRLEREPRYMQVHARTARPATTLLIIDKEARDLFDDWGWALFAF
jgi:hypothetical protein